MSEVNNDGADTKKENQAPINPFSSQATGLVETTFAETIGLSMHNAITNQQSAQMTASASITNACARLLQAPIPAPNKPEKDQEKDDIENDNEDTPVLSKKSKSWLNIKNFIQRKPKDSDNTTVSKIQDQMEVSSEPEATATDTAISGKPPNDSSKDDKDENK